MCERTKTYREQLREKIDNLYGTIFRANVGQEAELRKELKILEEEYRALPPDTKELGAIYLDTKITFENDRFKIYKSNGKWVFYDGSQNRKADVELQNGVPVKVIIPVISSDTQGELVNFVYAVKIDEKQPEAPIIKTVYKGQKRWICPKCKGANDMDYTMCRCYKDAMHDCGEPKPSEEKNSSRR